MHASGEPDKWIKKNRFYHEDLISFYKFHIPEQSRVLEIGSGTGYLLHALKPSYGVGIDVSSEMVDFAKRAYPELHFSVRDAKELVLNEKFDYIVVSDTLSLLDDVEIVFEKLRSHVHNNTRLLINTHSFLWTPIITLAEKLKLKSPQSRDNWLEFSDLANLLTLESFEVLKTGKRFLVPFYIPFVSNFINKYIANLPIFNMLCLTNFMIARPVGQDLMKSDLSVSVIMPVRNEQGTIMEAVKRIPAMGSHTEIVFVEGNSTDETYSEIEKAITDFPDKDIKLFKQLTKGKADATKMGLDSATGDILMILDGDLTVQPEELTKFYNSIRNNIGEFVYGSRLVYPVEIGAMQNLNIFFNKVFSLIFSWLLALKIKDTLCGTKVFSKENYLRMKSQFTYFGDFDPFGDFELILSASKLDLKFIEIPISYKRRKYGSTNISRFKNGFELLKVVFYSLNKIKFI